MTTHYPAPAAGFATSRPGPKPRTDLIAHAAHLHQQGLTYVEIGRRIGMSTGTARNYVRRHQQATRTES